MERRHIKIAQRLFSPLTVKYPDAIEVAEKLGIDILRTSASEDFIKANDPEVEIKAGNISFDEAWEKYIFPLKGRVLSNSRGR